MDTKPPTHRSERNREHFGKSPRGKRHKGHEQSQELGLPLRVPGRAGTGFAEDSHGGR
jgi:hypothetical protein